MLSRSLLFVPADKEKMLMKINQLDADIVIIDLEDAVALDDKQYARKLIKSHAPNWNKPVFIRINSIETNEYQKDLNLVNDFGDNAELKGIMLPKASYQSDIENLATQLEKTEKRHNKTYYYKIIPLIESAIGVKNASEIAAANHRVFKLAFGGVDFTNDIGAQQTKKEHELLLARSELVMASRYANISKPIDTVYTDIRNHEGLETSSRAAKSLGFCGKLLIHPEQIMMTHNVFSPSQEEIDYAQQLIEQVKHEGGSFQFQGKMIDRPIIDKAHKVLEDYKAILNKN